MTATAVSCPARRGILEIIAVPSNAVPVQGVGEYEVEGREGERSNVGPARSSSTAWDLERHRLLQEIEPHGPACGLGSRTAGVVSISRHDRAGAEGSITRCDQGLRPCTGPTRRPILAASRPSAPSRKRRTPWTWRASPGCRSSKACRSGRWSAWRRRPPLLGGRRAVRSPPPCRARRTRPAPAPWGSRACRSARHGRPGVHAPPRPRRRAPRRL
jgi:hypothetical protein